MTRSFRSFRLATLSVGAILLLTGCVRRPAESPRDGDGYWQTGLEAALAAASEGRYADAERTLIEAGGEDESTPYGLEVLYWRALFELAPSNRQGSAAKAAQHFDRYLRAGARAPRRHEVAQLRALAIAMRDGTTSAGETEKLKAELAKTQEELERIKRRLAQPRP